ncbi:MAG: ABC transporter permease [Parachlamydiaceae bacterium]|nr:ABC transporter permease [Parachlamydiaceae bacterium]
MINRIIALIIKEFHAIWRDKKSRAVLIVPPIIQLFIFAFAATLEVKNVTIGVINRDSGRQSIELVERLQGTPMISHVVFLPTIESSKDFIDNQRGIGVISIDSQFSKNLLTQRVANVQLLLDGRKSNASQIFAGYVATIIGQYNLDYAMQAGIQLQPTELVPRNWFNPNLLYYWFNIPSLSGILTLLVALILTALSVARERELGTFDQLLVSPVSSVEILIGKLLPSIFISMLEGSFIIFAAVFIFNIPFTGSLVLLYLSMFLFVSCIVGVGLFISSLCKTQQQAILGSSLFMTPSIILSGFATPIENMPAWLQPFTYLVPLRYYLIIAKGIFLKEMPIDLVLSNLWPLAIIAVLTLWAATWFFHHKLE